MSRALGLASTSKCVRSAGWAVWTVSLLASVIWMGAASAQGAATQQTCEASQSSLQVTRFQDNGDGTVTDVDSKLMWMRCSSGQSWANDQCTGQATAYNWSWLSAQAGDTQNISKDKNKRRIGTPVSRPLLSVSGVGFVEKSYQSPD